MISVLRATGFMAVGTLSAMGMPAVSVTTHQVALSIFLNPFQHKAFVCLIVIGVLLLTVGPIYLIKRCQAPTTS